MRLISIIISVILLYGEVNTLEQNDLYEANKWLNELYDTGIDNRFANQPPSQGEKKCTLSSKQNGTCVKTELCADSPVTDDPTTRFIERLRDDECAASETCCLQIKVDPPKNTTTDKPQMTCVTDQQEEGICVKKSLCSNAVQTIDPTTTFEIRERRTCHYLEACCLESNVQISAKPFTPNVPDGCGFTNPGGNMLREATGTPPHGLADYGDFPWMIALIIKANNKLSWNESYAGGGALIHPSVVLTAAHKVSAFKPNQIKIRAGEWDTRTQAEVYSHQEIDVGKIIIHEKFLSKRLHNDVALLILKSPVDLIDGPHIGVACLAPQLPPPGTRCFGMGWGKDFLNQNVYAVILKKLELPLVEASVCEKQYQGTRLTSAYKMDKSLTCAGGEKGIDTCVGDGGSPLVCPVAGQFGRFAVVGLVAYGLGCGIENLPGVYANVPNMYDWVGSKLTSESLNKSSFVY